MLPALNMPPQVAILKISMIHYLNFKIGLLASWTNEKREKVGLCYGILIYANLTKKRPKMKPYR